MLILCQQNDGNCGLWHYKIRDRDDKAPKSSNDGDPRCDVVEAICGQVDMDTTYSSDLYDDYIHYDEWEEMERSLNPRLDVNHGTKNLVLLFTL